MSKFSIVLGDWSGDGHEKSQEFIIVVPDEFTAEILGANYKKNVKTLGIDPEKFANEYDDCILPDDVAVKLAEYNVEIDEESYDEGMGEIYLNADDMLNILMFLFGHELDGFTWKLDEKPPTLVGNYGAAATGNRSIGYGLFGD